LVQNGSSTPQHCRMARAKYVCALLAITIRCAVASVIQSTGKTEGACAPGATLSDIPASAEAADTEVVHHPTGLTFRKHILKSNQPERILSGIWEKQDQVYMERAFKSDPNCTRPVFIDVGAAFGYYSLLAAVSKPCLQVQAFNPHPRFAEVMKLNVEDNIKSELLKSPNICINMAALSDTEGTTYMSFGYGGRIGHTRSSKTVKVPMTTLDAFVEKNVPRDTQILLVKLDVEGQEANVMKGAAKILQGCRVKFWTIGIHSNHLLQPVVDALKDNGYKITKASANGWPNGQVTAEC